MKLQNWMAFLFLTTSALCQAQIDTTKIEGLLATDRKEFVHSLRPNLAIDDETTILRAHLLKLVTCRITSDAAKQFCKDLKDSEDLKGQNAELLDFALSSKNLRVVLEAIAAVMRSAQTYAIGKEAKDQIISLAPVLASAIAKVNDPIKTAALVRKEIQSRPSATHAFSDSVALRVYEPFLRDALYWLGGQEPEGRGEPWEIAGAATFTHGDFSCRIRKSGKFQCRTKIRGQRVDFPMESEEGYSLALIPYQSAVGGQHMCSEGPQRSLHCWTAFPTSDGGIEIERCQGVRKRPASDSLYGSASQWYSKAGLATVTCEKSGEMVIGFANLDDSTDTYPVILNIAPNTVPDHVASFKGTKWAEAFFLNYQCRIRNRQLNCEPIDGLPANGLHLWTIDPQTHLPKDAGTENLFANLPTLFFKPTGVDVFPDGVCASEAPVGLFCRYFIIDGDKALAVDLTIETNGDFDTRGDHFIALKPTGLTSLVEIHAWRYKDYQFKTEIFDFTGALGRDRELIFRDYWSEERVACFDSLRMVDGRSDYSDKEWESGIHQRCVRLDDKNQILGDLESAIPLNRRPTPRKIGRAICIEKDGQLVCDFPATSKRLFERPILSINSSTQFYDQGTGYLCSTEADAAYCYDLKTPVQERPKPIRFMYRGFSKSLMLTRSMKIRTVTPGTDPWMCANYQSNYSSRETIYVCETSGMDPKVYSLRKDLEEEAPNKGTDSQPAPRTRSRSKRRASTPHAFFQSRESALRGYFRQTQPVLGRYPASGK